MKNPTLRAIIIIASLIWGAIYIYPTIGWMTLSPEAREQRLATWKQEDLETRKPEFFRDTWAGIRRWSQFNKDWVINLGLDIQGGINMIIGFDITKADPQIMASFPENWTQADIVKHFQEQTLRTIERRVFEFQSTEPIIARLGDDKIQVQLPGEKDLDRARDLIFKSAYLTFHLVAMPDEQEQVFLAIDKYFEKNSNKDFLGLMQKPVEGPYLWIPKENIEKVRALVEEARKVAGLIPEGRDIGFSGEPKAWEPHQVYRIYLMNKDPDLTGSGLQQAYARVDESSPQGNYMILFQFNTDSGSRMGQVTEANRGKPLAIVIDDQVESAPTIQDRITTRGQITGGFSREEAVDLAIALRSGSMPAPLVEESSAQVGASLGRDLIRRGVTSSILGVVVVVVFMLIYYRWAGIVADIALVMNAILLLAALAYFKSTLTLPGIAGLILTVGMAVDSNVLIYERIREELRNGRSLLAAVDSGFDRAAVTILDANITTLIAAAVLLQFGTGPVVGFAVTLSIGVCTSVFTALIVSRAIMDFLTSRKIITKLNMLSVIDPDSKIRFMERRNVAIAASCIAIVIGVILFALRGNENFGVDFMTGTNMIVSLDANDSIADEDVRERLSDAGFESPVVQLYENEDIDIPGTQFLIRVSEVTQSEQAAGTPEAGAPVEGQTPPESAAGNGEVVTVSQRIADALADLSTDPSQMVQRVDTVGPAVSAQLRRDALLAVLYSMFFIVLYLWFRFELKFSIGAVVALAHDVLITLGVFALLHRQINLPVVAAILTIIGYSLNDTIVVFDRIREALRLYRGRGMTYAEIMNLSINQTLSRTLLTSLTTLFVTVVLLIFGGDAIFDFALALTVGIIVGTYSSIFIASPITYYIQKYWSKSLVSGSAPAGAQSGPSSRRRKGRKGAAESTA